MKTIRTKAVPSNAVTEREAAHRKLAREVATESIVLLKNDGSLPISPGPVALYGAGAATTIKGGTGSGEVNERFSVTIEEGLKNAGFTITTDSWLREYEQYMKKEKAMANKAIAKKIFSANSDDRINIMANPFQYPPGRLITDHDIKQSQSDTCIYVIARQSGECSDRSLEKNDFTLMPEEIENLKRIEKSYKKIIVVINVGGPMDISPLDSISRIGAILFFCQQGMEGGSALAELLTGKSTPSGCLGSTWPKKYEDLPHAMEYSYLKGESLDEEYKEGIYVGYRYFDSFKVAPRYEFGYGLSYTDFSIACTKVSAQQTYVTVLAKVTNTGQQFSGKKCVQLYVSVPSGKLLREYQSLVAFAKTDLLSPGQSQEITLSFDLSSLAGYQEQEASYILEKGNYLLRLGDNARNTTVVGVIVLEQDRVTEVCENICKTDLGFEEIKPSEFRSVEIPQGVQAITVEASQKSTIRHSYDVPSPAISQKTQSVMDSLTLEDMLKVVVATGVMDSSPYLCVPGSAAYTTSHLVHKGVPNASLCDGPAGVRLQRASVRLKNGKIKPTEAMMEFLKYVPWIMKKFLFADPKKGTPLYQYTSAFPVGTALAQTWNAPLIEEVGNAMGVEMVEYGATFLLAPGIDIHRNPLCGRNYEYYSEDPLLTGKMAAAITKGVQSHQGCYTTLKHYTANNQETNRNRSNSIMSERVLREIYLKCYRIAIEEAGAKGVMTSYNKVNGTYTPNDYDLCTKVLRCEWGFEGVVMTDWFSTGKGLANNALAIKAGNDLICPGGGYYIKEIKKDLEAGLVSEEDIKLSCARILEAVINGRTGMEAANE